MLHRPGMRQIKLYDSMMLTMDAGASHICIAAVWFLFFCKRVNHGVLNEHD